MKKVLLLAFLFGSAFSVYAQLVLSSGSQLVVNSGSVVVANDVTNNGGTITNNGDVSILGNITNNSATMMAGTSAGTLTFEGTSAQEITGTTSSTFYGTVDINNANGVALTATSTGADQTIDGTLNFTSGSFTLNNFNLTLGSSNLTGADASNHVVTNGTGTLKRLVGTSDVVFPVGNSAYNPVILNNAGTSDTYSVQVVDAEPAASSNDHMVDRSWEIGEENLGGSDLTITPQWNSGNEVLTGFDPDNCSVGLTTNNGADYTWSETGAASGTNPYTKTGTSFTTTGTFGIGDYFYSGKRLDLKVFLAAAYNGTTMDKDLNTAGLIPAVDPYGVSLESTTIPTDAVDWIKVELRDQTTPTIVLHEYAFFVDVNGDILDRDGIVGGKITGATLTTPYNIAVLHRNHFGVMTSSTVDLDVASPSYDFSTTLNTAYDNPSISTNDAMKDLGSGVFGLWDGDANGDGMIRYDGTSNDRLVILNNLSNAGTTLNGYEDTDINMDGITRYDGTNNDRLEILNLIPNAGATFSRHLPQ